MDAIHGGARRWLLLALLPSAIATRAACSLLAITPGVPPAHDDDAHLRLSEACAALSTAGCDRLLLREPELSRPQVEALVDALLQRGLPPGEIVLHEKCSGARAIAAARGLGLHLRSTSDWKAERERWRGPLGASAHSAAELRAAAEHGLQWAFFSPVARPTSKPGDARPPIGEQAVLDAQRLLPALDVYALGGISPASAARLAAGGARGVAVLGGLFPHGAATTPEQARGAAAEYADAVHGRLQGALAADSARSQEL